MINTTTVTRPADGSFRRRPNEKPASAVARPLGRGRGETLGDGVNSAPSRSVRPAGRLCGRRSARRSAQTASMNAILRRAHLDVVTILAAEGWGHRAWRLLTKRPAAALTTPDRATPALDAWRKPSSLVGGHTYQNDATKRTLEDAIATVSASGR
jgi:hypothetical protein